AVRTKGHPAAALSRAVEPALAASPQRHAEQLLRLDDDVLRETLAALPPDAAAGLVAAATGLEGKSRLLWRLDRPGRAAALDRLSAPLIAALIQNLEEPNLPLLGDLSLEQFQRLMDLCSPERRYPWLRWALSLEDARANALPL